MAIPESLQQSFRGELLAPEDADYEAARTLYNAMIDKRPALIARCRDVADVQAALAHARETGLDVAIRGGGHNGPGLGSVDGGLVVDLSLMRSVRVDPARQTVRVGGGALWGDVDHAAHPFGLAVPSGIISTTGVGGLTLGGGHGYLARRHGLTVDNLLEADVVLADGRAVVASKKENEDLFWALRGGGGNFGVVTSFLFRGVEVEDVVGGPTLWPMERAAEVLAWYQDFQREMPRDLYGFFGFHTIPSPPFPQALAGKKMVLIQWCWTGDPRKAEAALKPMRAMDPAFEHVDALPWPALQQMFDGLYPRGLQWYWKGDFVQELPAEAIAKHVEHAAAMPTPLCTMHLYPIDGAVHDVPSDATAFAQRDATWSMVVAGVSEDPADNEDLARWARDYQQDLHPYAHQGAYVNFMMEEGQDRIRATYGGNHSRLTNVKKKYDPENFFHVNQNIEPAGTRGKRGTA